MLRDYHTAGELQKPFWYLEEMELGCWELRMLHVDVGVYVCERDCIKHFFLFFCLQAHHCLSMFSTWNMMNLSSAKPQVISRSLSLFWVLAEQCRCIFFGWASHVPWLVVLSFPTLCVYVCGWGCGQGWGCGSLQYIVVTWDPSTANGILK